MKTDIASKKELKKIESELSDKMADDLHKIV